MTTTTEVPAQLPLAATLRGLSHSWEAVAAEVNVPVAELRRWPALFLRDWRKAHRKGLRAAVQDSLAFTVAALQEQVTSGCPTAKRKAGELLIRYWSAGYRHRTRKPVKEEDGLSLQEIFRQIAAEALGDGPDEPISDEQAELNRLYDEMADDEDDDLDDDEDEEYDELADEDDTHPLREPEEKHSAARIPHHPLPRTGKITEGSPVIGPNARDCGGCAVTTSDPLAGSPAVALLIDTIQRLALARDVTAVQEIVRTAARRLTGADGATFVLRDGDRCHYVDEDAIAPLWKGQKFPMSACVSGWAMLNRRPAVIPDIYADARIPQDAYRPTFVKSLVMVPIRTLDPVGAIGNYWAAPHAPTDGEVRLLQALADSTAVALENVRVIGELEERVKARTAELEETNLRLTETNADLRAAQERTDRVFAAYSHALVHTVLDDKYRLDEELGSGGFGVVLRGHHLALDRPIAVKVFRPRPGNDSGQELTRFLREGATAARLNHPNVVRVYDSAVSADGIAYLVMELLHGRTLGREVSEHGPLPAKRAVRIAATVADVLAAAHRAGILHRDIKPENVFLHTADGPEVVKVVDFGIAKVFGEAKCPDATRFTRAGAYVGTPAFVAPELMLGADDDGRSDVFSLGVVMYHALTGVLPWPAGQSSAVLLGTAAWLPPPPISQYRSDLPPNLEAIVMRTLAWKPYQRPTAAELAETLHELEATLPDRTPRPELVAAGLPRSDDDEFWLSALR